MTKRHIQNIENELVTLRLLQEEDLQQTLKWRNQDSIRKWFRTTDAINMDKHLAWYKHYLDLDNDFVFMILSKEMGNIPIGQVSLYAIDWKTKIGEYGRLMIGHHLARGKGLAKSASQLILRIAFDMLGLERIVLEVKDNNVVAKSIYQSIGFSEIDYKDKLILMEKAKQ
ncbi:MAG: GNAT family N-acetyltransferase [Deltaproteobacteria bacterium]|nr:GNAT family N-acetyltransferase [Deltaproteobacteria bacterium]